MSYTAIAGMSLITAGVGAAVWNRKQIMKVMKKGKSFFKKKDLTMPDKTLKAAITKGKTATDPNKSQKEQKRAFNEGAKKLNDAVNQQVKTKVQKVDKEIKQDTNEVKKDTQQKIATLEKKEAQQIKSIEKNGEQEKKAIEDKAK